MYSFPQSEITKHLHSGELEMTGNGFYCKPCGAPLGQQPMAHIKGSVHNSKIFLEIIEHNSKYPSLFADLPSEVRDACRAGYLKRGGLAIICTLCDNKQTGRAPLVAHLASKSHANHLQSHNFKNVNSQPVRDIQPVSSIPIARKSDPNEMKNKSTISYDARNDHKEMCIPRADNQETYPSVSREKCIPRVDGMPRNGQNASNWSGQIPRADRSSNSPRDQARPDGSSAGAAELPIATNSLDGDHQLILEAQESNFINVSLVLITRDY